MTGMERCCWHFLKADSETDIVLLLNQCCTHWLGQNKSNIFGRKPMYSCWKYSLQCSYMDCGGAATENFGHQCPLDIWYFFGTWKKLALLGTENLGHQCTLDIYSHYNFDTLTKFISTIFRDREEVDHTDWSLARSVSWMAATSGSKPKVEGLGLVQAWIKQLLAMCSHVLRSLRAMCSFCHVPPAKRGRHEETQGQEKDKEEGDGRR